jgi:vacuolar-type H+-ATPase subunit B/Vma2
VTGTCNNYVYPYNMDQKGANTLIAINTADKQVKTNTNCDPSDDLLFIQPFEKSTQLTLSSSSINGVGAVMNLMDTAGNPSMSLRRVS